jgi:selenocysteine lyase/cysteine desulfurase
MSLENMSADYVLSSSTVSDRAFAELVAPFSEPGPIHLNNAGVAPITSRCERAITDTAHTMREGSLGMGKLLRRYEQARASFGRLVGCEAQNLAFFQTCAAAISQVAFGFPLKAGDHIVRLDQEYPSNAYPWHRAAERAGAVVDVVTSADDYSFDHDAIVAAIGPSTRVVALSFVQFQTGATLDVARVVEAAHSVGAVVVLDAIQGLGILPFDMRALGVDAVCGGTHKWLMGPVGHGFLGLSDDLRQRLTPILQGAITYGTPDDPVDVDKAPRVDVRRFEPGTPMMYGAIGGAASVDLLLEVGQPRLLAAATAVSDAIEAKAKARGFVVRPRSESPIIAFVPGQMNPRALADALIDDDISVGVRGGGLRFAPHGFNSTADVERVFERLDVHMRSAS